MSNGTHAKMAPVDDLILKQINTNLPPVKSGNPLLIKVQISFLAVLEHFQVHKWKTFGATKSDRQDAPNNISE